MFITTLQVIDVEQDTVVDATVVPSASGIVQVTIAADGRVDSNDRVVLCGLPGQGRPKLMPPLPPQAPA